MKYYPKQYFITDDGSRYTFFVHDRPLDTTYLLPVYFIIEPREITRKEWWEEMIAYLKRWANPT